MTVTQTAPIELYYWPTPNGWKISILLEELGIPYEVKFVDIGKGEQFEPSFLAIAPNNRMPAIVDPEGPGGAPVSIFESGAIMQYLGRKFGRFYPASDERARIAVDEWLMWQMGNVGPMFGQNGHFNNYALTKVPYAIERYTNETHRLFGVLEKRLDGRDYVAGDYSIADMAIYSWVRIFHRLSIDIEEFPRVKAWLDRIRSRPAVERGLDVGRDLRHSRNLATDLEAQKVLFGQRADTKTTSEGAKS